MLNISNQKGNGMIAIIIIAFVIIGGGAYFYMQQNTNNNQDTMMEDKQMIKNENDAMTDDDYMEKDPMMEDGDSAMTDDKDSMMEDDSDKMMAAGQYTDYSKGNYDNNADKKRVLFFHAKWCPTCIAANIAFNNNLDKIPADVVLLKTDYDSEKELKAKYGITYQHTFVLVDAQGNALAKWNGGDIDELIKNTK